MWNPYDPSPIKRYQNYVRFARFEQDDLAELFAMILRMRAINQTRYEINGVVAQLVNKRTETLARDGGVCMACGHEPTHAWIEDNTTPRDDRGRWLKNPPPLYQGDPFAAHLNVYCTTKEGHELLMTVDHVIPKSRGGRDRLDNFVVLCQRCNFIKGSDAGWLKDLPRNRDGQLMRRSQRQIGYKQKKSKKVQKVKEPA